MYNFHKVIVVLTLSLYSWQAPANQQNVLPFSKAIKQAQKVDPWLKGNVYQQQATESLSEVALALPDPKVSIGIANLATDSFDFNQEAMSQLKVGISQMFPRGDSREIKNRQLMIESEKFPFQRQNRQAQVAVTVGSLWLDGYLIEQTIALIDRNYSLFSQLVELANNRYASTSGRGNQQDVVRAELELSKVEEKLEGFYQQKNNNYGLLLQWLNASNISQPFSFGEHLPTIELAEKIKLKQDNWSLEQAATAHFLEHPAVLALDKKIQSTAISIQLAKQKYQSQWGINASYAYRDDDPMGNNRADLLSVGITFDLPLFTENKQDKQVKATISQTEAVKTDKQLLLRKMLSNYASTAGRLARLFARKSLYRDKLLPQYQLQSAVTLNAYTNDRGDFNEVIRANIAEQDAQIKYLALLVEEQKLSLALNYLFVNSYKNQYSALGASTKHKNKNIEITHHEGISHEY